MRTQGRVQLCAPATEFDATELASLAVSALIDEAELTPKPALVDQRGNGAHHDLDLALLRRSAWALKPGFAAIARAAAEVRSSSRLREQLGRLGRAMENEMEAATDGSNAHRGAIWSLGLLVAAVQRSGGRDAGDIAFHAAKLARLPDRFAAPDLSHGDQVCGKFHVKGARGEAQAGFPHVVRVGLPALRAARARGVGEERARLDALMEIMARLDDTCLLHRGGRGALDAAKRGARAVLAAGGTSSGAGMERLAALHEELMARWASPGGSADLLAATMFLDRWERTRHPFGRSEEMRSWRR